MFRTFSLAVLLVTGALTIPPQALAVWQQYYCGRVLQPGEACASNYPHSLYYGSAAYFGAPSHRVTACTYLFNHNTGRFRGGVIACRRSDNGDGVARVDFGPTYDPVYQAVCYLDPGDRYAHSVDCYTRTAR